ncbi:DUF3540 domain-containing protein [Pantoea sp. Al-1710]|jgi:hypothetical protein|uniref:DUF3540 domain-containing protein n=1 Tax=Candidatus Pantoea communis TaxID=2608354 RepID=A0ABX0RHQ0_9GAMM|nr:MULTISPECIES: DUF3540 domain-containing protein [Enterobacterales]KGT91499.1 hypothetical protein NH00_07965 [Enterobacter cancerogenus]NIG17151.1 DUF3540 domain-containing protein [Pantoea communis]
MNHAEKTVAIPLDLPLQAEGQVLALDTDYGVQVLIDGRRWHCQRAASCLLSPQVDDRVLVSRAGEQLWLLAVLVRAQPEQTAELHCEGKLTLSSSQSLSLRSPQFQLEAEHGDCQVTEMSYRGEKVSAWVTLSRVFGKRCESLWESLSQISHHLLRRTTHTEQVRAGQLDIKTSQLTRLHAPTTLISSESLTRVDGKQIHMG